MSSFKFDVNWTLNGVGTTSQTYTHIIWAHMRDLHWRCQDGVVMTQAYMARVLKMPVSVLCRRCHSMTETIGHILAKCETYFWSLYMERHNRVLAVVHQSLGNPCQTHLRTTKPKSCGMLASQQTGTWRTVDLICWCNSRRGKPYFKCGPD